MNHPFPVICQLTLNKHGENTSGEGFLLNRKKGNEASGGPPSPACGAEETRRQEGPWSASCCIRIPLEPRGAPAGRALAGLPLHPLGLPAPDSGLEHSALGLMASGGARPDGAPG